MLLIDIILKILTKMIFMNQNEKFDKREVLMSMVIISN